ncbi:MAG: hypothetical protein KF842_06965 [Caulobacter sp.]|nr:hypothetical protein [Caulobacter sp.]
MTAGAAIGPALMIALGIACLIAGERILTGELSRATPGWLKANAPLLAGIALLTLAAVAWTFVADLPPWADGFRP